MHSTNIAYPILDKEDIWQPEIYQFLKVKLLIFKIFWEMYQSNKWLPFRKLEMKYIRN